MGCKSLQHFYCFFFLCYIKTCKAYFRRYPGRKQLAHSSHAKKQDQKSQVHGSLACVIFLEVTLLICLLTPPSICPKPDDQFQFTFRSSGMKTLRAFLIMGCGFSSSSENLRLRGSNISWPGMLERARSAGSGS